MNRIILAIAVSMSTLLTTPAFAGHEDVPPKSAEGTSPANIEVIALQERLAYCINNVKSEGFSCNTYVGCSDRKRYVDSCMKFNETPVQYASINRKITPTNTDTAVTHYNELLQQAPTAAGNK